jgi:hypothetical protein
VIIGVAFGVRPFPVHEVKERRGERELTATVSPGEQGIVIIGSESLPMPPTQTRKLTPLAPSLVSTSHHRHHRFIHGQRQFRWRQRSRFYRHLRPRRFRRWSSFFLPLRGPPTDDARSARPADYGGSFVGSKAGQEGLREVGV